MAIATIQLLRGLRSAVRLNNDGLVAVPQQRGEISQFGEKYFVYLSDATNSSAVSFKTRHEAEIFSQLLMRLGAPFAYAYQFRYPIIAGAAAIGGGILFIRARRAGAWGRRKDAMLTYGKASARPMSGVKSKRRRSHGRGRR